MFPRQLISHKEVFRAAIGSIAAAAIHHCLNKNGESHAEGNNTPAPRSYHHHTIPPHLPDFFSLSSTSLTSNITNYAHCDASSLSASTALKIPPLVEDRRSFTYEANDPLEDRRRSGTCGAWTYGAVFDGHGGPQIADMASRRLLERIFDKIYEIDHNNEILVDETMTSAFNDMEQEIIDTIRPAFNTGFGDVAKVGSCVLVALRRGKKLIIANCGDCRVVMGSTSRDAYDPLKQDKIYHTQINRDHNCRVRLEQDNLQKNHPNEPNLIVCKSENACYVKGRLQLTRSLGDAYLKYAEFNGNPALGRSGGRYIPDPYTPPYVSHQPDMHHITLEKEDRFLILGTDGLWDYLRGDAAVDIVFRGMKEGKNEEKIASELVEEALKIAARESGMSFETLKQLPKGRQRRSHHDDTTAVVLFL